MKKHIDVIDILMSAIWFLLLVILMIRMPVAKIIVDTKAQFSGVDIALSCLFCAIGFICPVLAFAFSKKHLFALPFVNTVFFVAMIACFVISISSANTVLFSFACYFVNLFCFVLSFKGNFVATCAIFLVAQITFAVLFSYLLRIKKEK